MAQHGSVPAELRGPTTISTRLWASKAVSDAAEIIARNPNLLSPDLAELANDLGPKNGGFPLWLVHGLAAKHFLQWVERRNAPTAPAPADEPPAKTERITARPEESERVIALRDELAGLASGAKDKKRRLAIEKQLKDLGSK